MYKKPSNTTARKNVIAGGAVMHLEMIVQAASGDYSPRPGELEKRRAALAAFIVTVADDSDWALTAKVNEVVSSHFLATDATSAEQIAEAS